MKTIQVLGPGCPKCKLLAEQAERAAQSLGIEYQIEKITDIKQMVALGVMTTPALVVDGALKLSGRVPSVETLKELLS